MPEVWKAWIVYRTSRGKVIARVLPTSGEPHQLAKQYAEENGITMYSVVGAYNRHDARNIGDQDLEARLRHLEARSRHA